MDLDARIRLMIDALLEDRQSFGPHDGYKWRGVTDRIEALNDWHEELTGETYPPHVPVVAIEEAGRPY